MTKRERPEERLQQAIVTAISRMAPKVYCFHIPNGGLRSKLEAIRMKAGGVRRGVPDLCLILSDGEVAFVEIKAAGGKLSPEQMAFSLMCLNRSTKWALLNDVAQVETLLSAWGEIPARTNTMPVNFGTKPAAVEVAL